MKQLLRSDLYKLNKARYFWICLVINIVLAVLSVFIIDFSYRVAGDAMATSLEAQDQAMQENGVNISTDGLARSYARSFLWQQSFADRNRHLPFCGRRI